MTKSEIKKLDKLWKEKLFEDMDFKCELTGLQKGQIQLHPHHYIGRRNRATRWYLPNGVCLSASKHTMSIWSAHQNPEWFRSQMLDLRGQKWLNDLQNQSNKVFKGTYDQVKDYLEGKTKNYL